MLPHPSAEWRMSGRFFRYYLLATCAATIVHGKPPLPVEAAIVARHVLDHAVIIDMHADTPLVMLDRGYDVGDPNSPYMISIAKMRRGRLSAQFFAIWVEPGRSAGARLRRALDLIDVVYEQVARHSHSLALATTADDIVRLHYQNKIAILLGVEGGYVIENDPRLLNTFYHLGVRYLTLTHSVNTDWADSSGDAPKWNGLADFGRELVARMNRLGMMVDVSHASDKTFYDVLSVTQAPAIASHSSCRALADHPRNLSDDMLRALAKNGGVIHINFYPGYLDQGFAAARRSAAPQMKAELEKLRQQYQNEPERLSEKTREISAQYAAQLPLVGLERVADHIDHVVKIAGVDHVGLGSDFDGIDATPHGMEDISRLADLVVELARRGYKESDLKKILGGNTLRVMREVEKVARRISAQQGGKP